MKFKEIAYIDDELEFYNKCENFQDNDEVSEDDILKALNLAKDHNRSQKLVCFHHLSILIQDLINLKFEPILWNHSSDINWVYDLIERIHFLNNYWDLENYNLKELCERTFNEQKETYGYKHLVNIEEISENCKVDRILDIDYHLKNCLKWNENYKDFVEKLQPFLDIYNIEKE